MLNVCSSCVNFGTEVKIQSAVQTRITRPQREITEQAINPDFAAIIKKAREAKSLTRKQFANRINEKTSVIERVEKGMRPDARLRKKLESALDVYLGYQEESVQLKPQKSEEYTLGDAVQIRIRKRKSSF